MTYFREFPDIEYLSPLLHKNSSLDYVRAKNLFRRVKLRDDLQNVFVLFNKYQIPDGSRPDLVAEELYGSAEYDWVVLLSAGITRVRDQWPLSDRDVYRFSENKYGIAGLSEIKFYETIEVKDSKSRLILPAGKVVDSNFRLPLPSDNISGSFNASAVNISSLTASGEIINPLNKDYILTTDKYGSFVINTETLSWIYTFNLEKALSSNLNYDPTGKAEVEDILSYISTDGISRTYKLRTTISGGPPILTSNKTSSDISYIEYYDSNLNTRVLKSNIVTGITNYEYEVRKNNEKRSINVLKPQYLQQYLNDFRREMYYDKSSQYVDKKLIRTENLNNTSP